MTLAKQQAKGLSIERFGSERDSTIYFTLYNPGPTARGSTVMLDAKRLGITRIPNVEEMIGTTRLSCRRNGELVEVPVTVRERSCSVLKVTKQ